nr:zinc-binding dehydrogenase [Cellulomonas sp. IC4_254]
MLLDRPGPPESLRVGHAPDPAPGPGQVRVRVEACGLNPVDHQVAAAGNPAWSWPHVPGLDVVGSIDALGDGVEHLHLGQRVAYHGDLRRAGGLAELALASATTVAVVPRGVAPAAAAALPCAGMTAYQSVRRRLHVAAGDTLLVTGGAGGVGGFAVQLGALAGATVIATAARADAAHVRALGATHVVDHHTEDVPARVQELTAGRGVDAVVDTVGTESAERHLRLLVHGGGLAAVAGRPELTAVPPFTTAPSVHEIALGAAHSHGDLRARADLAAMLSELLALTASGELDPMVSRTVALADVPDALSAIKQGRGRGKVVYLAEGPAAP